MTAAAPAIPVDPTIHVNLPPLRDYSYFSTSSRTGCGCLLRGPKCLPSGVPVVCQTRHTLYNTGGFHVLADLPRKADGTVASFTDENGLIWYGGSNTSEFGITAIPIQFGAGTVTSVTVDFLDCGTDTNVGAPFIFEFDCEGEEAETDVNGITPVITSVAGGSQGPAGIVNEDPSFSVRIDYSGS